MNKVSIIVPVYNTEKYLEKCIDSLVQQSYENLEIILVNDGSTDKSLLICKAFERKDDRIKVLNKQNSGVELARKSGYQKATGEFIMYVDSDDYLPLNAVKILLDSVLEENADIIIGNITRIIGNRGFIKKVYKCIPECIISQKEMMDQYYISFFGVNILPVNMCGNLYRKSFLESVKIKSTGLTHGEDLCYNIQIFPYASKTVVLEKNVYFYRWGGMTSNMNKTLFDDARKAYRLKSEMLNKFEVKRGEYFIAVELKNFFNYIFGVFYYLYQNDQGGNKSIY